LLAVERIRDLSQAIGAVVRRSAFRRLNIVPRIRHAARKDRPHTSGILIGMQPPKEKRHVAPQLLIGSLRTRSQHAITVCTRVQKHLLDEEGSGFLQEFGRPAGKFARSARCRLVADSQFEQNVDPGGKWLIPKQSHARWHLEEIDGKLKSVRMISHHALLDHSLLLFQGR
jgi:hypothetical protein